MPRALLATCFVFIVTAVSDAQNAFFYPAPPAGSVVTSKDVPYGEVASVTLQMDVYRPARAGAASPALIFFNRAVGAQRTAFTFYVRWAETAASKGLVAIVPDLRLGSEAGDFQILMDHLMRRSTDYGIDREALAVYAGSGNVFTALPVVENVKQTAVKAAVMYYGAANVPAFRPELPLLIVRAGLDRPPVNAAIASLAAAAVAQNAPVTLLNHPTGHHAFEMVDDDETTRAVIDETIDFVRRATSSSYQTALRAGLPEAVAAGHVSRGNFSDAAAAYAKLVAVRPADARLRLSYGEALLGDKQFAAACNEFERLKDKGLGPRDLGVPAARACAQAGDPDRAIAWLQSIPQRFLPPDIQKDAALASLVSRPDFQTLFKR